MSSAISFSGLRKIKIPWLKNARYMMFDHHKYAKTSLSYYNHLSTSDNHMSGIVHPRTCDMFVKIQIRPFILQALWQDPATGRNLPGQGLKKTESEEDKLTEENSVVLRYIDRRIEEQNAGRKAFPLLPDYKFIINLACFVILSFVAWKIVHPDFVELIFGVVTEPKVDKAIAPNKPDSFIVFLYKSAPLRFLSRLWGRMMETEMRPFARPPILKLFCKLSGANLDEALVSDLSSYKSIGAFFRRPIDPTCRPVLAGADLTSPADGKVLTFGTINKGQVEQVKGVTYSLQKFLGPLTKDPDHNQWGGKLEHVNSWCTVPLDRYQKALMRDPVNNELYQCVVYLAPGDYHRFHSPCEWVMRHRRHMDGELLSVNPRIASIVKDLFILNERVVLSGEWKHGYFSMTAVGATSVGSIKINNDLLLRTNAVKWRAGNYRDLPYEDGGCPMQKGDEVGQFSFGSTIVLIFEAPKSYQFELEEGQKLKFGQRISHKETDAI